jgi:hypothetical protein
LPFVNCDLFFSFCIYSANAKNASVKGVNSPAKNGVLSETVTGGLAPGTYRLASINAAENHQPVLMPIAQHGSTDDMVYFTVKSGGNGNNNNNQGKG